MDQKAKEMEGKSEDEQKRRIVEDFTQVIHQNQWVDVSPVHGVE